MPTVFICHASTDKPFARRLTRDLTKRGIDVWIDERAIRVGDSLYEQIERGLRSADYVIVVFSRMAMSRAWVRSEIGAALALEAARHRRAILPVVLSTGHRPLLLADRKYADFTKHYRDGLNALVGALERKTAAKLREQLSTIRAVTHLSITRTDGSLARCDKLLEIQCHHGSLSEFEDVFSFDGSARAFTVNPGRITRVSHDGDVTKVRTRWGKPLVAGRTRVHRLKCVLVNTFCKAEEFWYQRQYYPTEHIELLVRFPRSRPPRSWRAVEQRGPDMEVLTDQIVRLSHAQMPTLRWNITAPHLFSHYLIQWSW